MLKRNVETNDDEIFDKVTSSGTPYYKFYAITEKSTEKVYVSSFQEAEDVVNQLKDKKSTNASDLGIVEKYETAKAEFKDVSTCVNELYKKRVVYSNPYKYIGTTIVNEPSVATNLGITLIRPVSGIITSRFGIRSRDNHKGLDIAAPLGTAIKAACAGTVIFSGNGAGNGYSGYGNVVVVRCTDSLVILYGHCSEVNCRTGEQVAQGQIIAKVGSTGISTGNHLHFEMRYNGSAIDPQNYVYN